MHSNRQSVPASRMRAAWLGKAGLLALAVAALLTTTACNKLQARDNLNRGVQAYKNADYEKAIERFEKAVQLDPSLLTARLYLATAYANQVAPEIDTPENRQNARRTIDTYNDILTRDLTTEQKVLVYKGLASTYEKIKDWDNARKDWQMLSQLDPNDPQTYYRLGVIDWVAAYKNAQEIKQNAGLRLDPAPNPNGSYDESAIKAAMVRDAKVCAQIKAKNAQTVQDGIDLLNRATKLRPDYDDAYSYLNLFYRRKADLECGDEQAYRDDIKMADSLNDKVLKMRKEKAEREAKKTGGPAPQ
jgi:tetratricopeptide (TPR) repeat protein